MLVKMENAVKDYGEFRLECSLEIKPGYVTGLIGQNGAGKTTAFKAVLGLITIESGTIEVLGKNPFMLLPEDRQKIGVILAEAGFSNYLTAKAAARIQKELYRNFDYAGFIKRCGEMGLPLDKQIRKFSSGMKAKFRLLCAMSHDAELMILDEPTAGLDVIARDEVLDMLREYMDTESRGILISSHISSDLEGLCDDIYMIDNGRIVMHEDTDKLLGSYGIIKAQASQYESLDKEKILRVRKETFGVSCLTNDRAYYLSRYPGLVVDNGGIDSVMTMMIRGEKL
ncbi:MAG: ABC transporter ATP-binding protein [Clostridiaceae bacterium]|nr:ABC transporter ATP-binding protein [Clostridiaceae bacterium]